MENNPTNLSAGNKKQSLTPRELVHRHMENPDEPITDEDIENMDLSDQLPEHEKRAADEEAAELEKDDTGTAYDVVDN